MVIERGAQLLATDITDLTFFPKGTILTFSTDAWNATSAEFKNIWKICNATNHAANPAIPDLTDKFLRGSSSSGGTGTGKMTLTTAHLPAHTHPAGTLSATQGTTAATGGDHVHNVPTVQDDWNVSGGTGSSWGADNGPWGNYNHAREAGAHSHAIAGNTGSTGSSTVFDIIPAYYAVIYIMKVV